MSSLAAPTEPAWSEFALAHLPELLVDHAHCEKKAAATALGLLFRYPQHEFLLAPLSRFAREELVHFERVLRALSERGIAFRRLRPASYASALREAVRAAEPGRLVDTLLCCALIEARSCERLELLADRADAPDLADLFRGLVAAEVRHERLFVTLASRLDSQERVRARLRELAAHEARVLADAPVLARVHGGVPRGSAV